MKLISRIMVILMALVLVLGVSAASAEVPSNLAQIENLPELPEYPTMKCKTVQGTTTITLSAPLTWLNVIQNWNWMDIITWNEDKTVGTYSTAGFHSAAGTGTYSGHWLLDNSPQDGVSTLIPYADFTYPVEGIDENGKVIPEILDEKGKTQYPSYGEMQAWDGAYRTRQEAKDYGYNGSYHAEYYVKEKFDYTGKQAKREDRLWKETIGTYSGWYDMGFAYDGGLADGSDIKYTASGKVASITVTKTGENYLANEKAPVKSEVTYKWMYGRPYIAEIKETYDDDSTCTATFNFNGVRIKLH